MKNFTWILIFSLSLMGNLFAQVGQKVTSKIDEVTVYLEGAIVNRSGNQQLTTGITELLFTNFPAGLNSDLIRVKADPNVKILDVNYRLLTSDEKSEKSLQLLNEKAKKLRLDLDRLAIQQSALVADLKFVEERNTLFRNNDNPTAQQMREMDTYLAQRRLSIRNEMLVLQTKQESLNTDMQKINAELKEATLSNLAPEYVLAVRVDASSAGRKNFAITYYTPKAGWIPSYQVRVSKLTEPISFELTAAVDQESGEDWTNVELKLSTGNPTIGAEIPEMRIWPLRPNERYFPAKRSSPQAGSRSGSGQITGYVLDRETGGPVAFASLELRDNRQNRYAVSADAQGKFSKKDLPVGYYNILTSAAGYNTGGEQVQIYKGSESVQVYYLSRSNVQARGGRANSDVVYIDNIVRLEKEEIQNMPARDVEALANTVRSGNSKKVSFEEIAVAEEQFTTMVYSIEKRHTIPSTGMSRDIQVSKATIAADYVHVVRPALDEGAFLQAYITDWEALRLLRGKAMLYLEDAYMGSTLINPLETSDTLSLSLGRDPQVIVKRERTLTSSSKSFFGTTVREQFSYEIDVRNSKRVPIRLIVEDQIPISQHKDIVVSKILIDPEVPLNLINGFLRWDLSLTPSQNSVLQFGFEVSRPKDMRLINLPIY